MTIKINMLKDFEDKLEDLIEKAKHDPGFDNLRKKSSSESHTEQPESAKNNFAGETFNDLVGSVLQDGVIDVMKLYELQGRFGYLPGRYINGKKCDVLVGPCSCGASHTENDLLENYMKNDNDY